MSVENTFLVTRPVLEDTDRVSLAVEHYCRQTFPDDFSHGIILPEGPKTTTQTLVGESRYKIMHSMALPLYELSRPESEGYRSTFHYAARRFDEPQANRAHNTTQVTQVSRWIMQNGLAYDVADQDRLEVRSSQMDLRFTTKGHILSAVVESAGLFEIEHSIITNFMKYIGKIQKKDLRPDEKFVPRIPLARIALNATEQELAALYDKTQLELPAQFVLGKVRTPKVY
ncbi:MAG: hypothetical protein QG629_801 [Patescibacteria group bacterium]|nr:hypothetical protein [Candidatus Saccharibacteria bacterium]MDQ5963718.1 hypothetical protein [Patescibacteria group bacterium]